MILRVVSASFAAADAATVIDLLRAQIPRARAWPGLVSWTHGIRREGEAMHGLTLTVWTDFDAVRAVGNGRIDRDLTPISDTGVIRRVAADHFEMVDPPEGDTLALDGSVLGVVRGMVRPGSEPRVHELVRDVRDEVTAAGVTALHVGRRVIAGMTELVVVAVWRERARLHVFAQRRDGPTIATAFTDELTAWRFETYDAVTPTRLEVPTLGDASILVDDAGICVDVTAGVERVVGFPGELVLRLPVADLVAPESRAAVAELCEALLRDEPRTLADVRIRGGDGRGDQSGRRVSVRSEPADQSSGLHRLHLELTAGP
jgi:PAS domain-containing protein